MILIAGILLFMSYLGVADSYKIDEIKERIQELKERKSEIQSRKSKFSDELREISRDRNSRLADLNRRLRNYKLEESRTRGGFARHLWQQPIRNVRRRRDNLQSRDHRTSRDIRRLGYKIDVYNVKERNKRGKIDDKRRRLNRLRK